MSVGGDDTWRSIRQLLRRGGGGGEEPPNESGSDVTIVGSYRVLRLRPRAVHRIKSLSPCMNNRVHEALRLAADSEISGLKYSDEFLMDDVRILEVNGVVIAYRDGPAWTIIAATPLDSETPL